MLLLKKRGSAFMILRKRETADEQMYKICTFFIVYVHLERFWTKIIKSTEYCM